MKKIRLLIAWQQFSKGHEFEVGGAGGMPAAQAEVMVARGLAEEVKPSIGDGRRRSRAGMRAGQDYVTR